MHGRYHYIVNTAMITGACLIMIVLMHIVDLALLCLAKFGILFTLLTELFAIVTEGRNRKGRPANLFLCIFSSQIPGCWA